MSSSNGMESMTSCCICDEEFSSDNELASHLIDHTEDEEFGLKDEPKSNNTSLTNTRRGSLSSTSQSSKDPEVWEIVSDDSDDDGHFRLVTPSNKPQQPQPPPPSLKRPSQNGVAEKDTTFKCMHCQAGFKNLQLLQEHIVAEHEQNRRYTCEICNKTFAYKTTLRQHLHLHVSDRQHECRVCHKRFSLKSVLRKHEESHEMQPQLTKQKQK